VRNRNAPLLVITALLVSVSASTRAQDIEEEQVYASELIKSTPYVVWYGSDETMTAERLAAYCAPILWFSPDEPLLEEKFGKDITIPNAFPFEEDTGKPVVYFRFRKILERGVEAETAFNYEGGSKADAVMSIKDIAGIDIDFFFYYPWEEGLNAHEHDVESVQMKVAVARGDTEDTKYVIAVTRIVGKAHGVLWYDNTLESGGSTYFPIHILVEEAKHASCTDKNGDGLYTPGYDVNKRVNDAWGVRDIIRSGGLFSASWQSWMAKMRPATTRVFPPTPADSPRLEHHKRDGVYAPDNAIYELRPFPTAEKADEHLEPFIADKGYPDWPEVSEISSIDKFGDWAYDESFAKSFSLALRIDGHAGISFMFPFFIFKNFEDPLAGGYILHRVYLTGEDLQDFGYTAVYTPSASRWIDPYFAVGFEDYTYDLGDGTIGSNTSFQMETGFKFRVNVLHTPFKIGRKLGTDFWGLRLGIQYRGAWEIRRLGYVVEIGAGSF
jgi:hypothetical protein